MGDQDERLSRIAPDAADLLVHLVLHDHVEGRRGLIGDDQGRVQGEGHGDDGPLAHATAELMGVAADPFRFEADEFEKPLSAIPCFAVRARFVRADGLNDLPPHADNRVQGIHCALGNKRDLAPAHLPDLLGRHAEKVPAPKEDSPLGDLPVGGEDPENGPRYRRLAAARFSDYAERFPIGQVK